MIKTITVKNFKKIKEVHLELGRVNVLIGPNNSGKSSFIQAVQFAVSSLQSISSEAASVVKWKNDEITTSLGNSQFFYAPVQDLNHLGRLGHFSQSKGIEVAIEEVDGLRCSVLIKKGKNKNLQVKATGHELGSRMQVLDSLYSVFAPGLAGIPSTEELRTAGVVRKAAARGDANQVLRNVLYRLKAADGDKWQEFGKRIETIFPGLVIDVLFDEDRDDSLSATADFGSGILPLELSGTGVLQAVQLLAYVGLYKPSLLILDEPDSHLHPNNQRLLLRVLGEAAEKQDFQVLMSTHSRHMLDEAMSLGGSISWFSDGDLVNTSDDVKQGLLDLGALDAVDKLGGSTKPMLILTEDDQGDDYISAVARANGWPKGSFEIFSYSGSSNTLTVKKLVNFIESRWPDKKLVVYRDRDYDSQSLEDFQNAVTKSGKNHVFFLTSPGKEVESYFTQKSHLAHVLQGCLKVDELEDLLEKAYLDTFEVSRSKLANAINNDQLFGVKRTRPTEVVKKADELLGDDRERWCASKELLGALISALRVHNGLSDREVREMLLEPSGALRAEGFPDPSPSD